MEILDEYDHLRYVSEPDDGQSDAINKGFEMADGDVVAWLNSDDVFFDTEVIERVVDYLGERDAEVIYGDMALLDGGSNVLKLQCVPDFDIHKLLRYCFVEQPALFFDGEVVSQHRLDEELEYVMDYEFWLRLSRQYEFEHVDDVLAGDRNHEQRKILADREAMQAEARELQRQYGVRHGRRFQFDRAVDRLFSGIPRRVTSAVRTLSVHLQDPKFAFDGELRPAGEMLQNLRVPNHELV
jgi:glycosyltransferase involved in cell wall biosynthesis